MMTKATETKTNKIIKELYHRLQWHHEEFGEAVRNDPMIWETFDRCTGDKGKSVLQGIMSLAKMHKQFSLEQKIWAEERISQQDFSFRGQSAKWKTSDQNRLIWKTLMQVFEVIRQNTKPDPKRDLFK